MEAPYLIQMSNQDKIAELFRKANEKRKSRTPEEIEQSKHRVRVAVREFLHYMHERGDI